MLGPKADFELEWVSVYQFACRRIDQFCVGRVIFAGDAAHQVSPFGARGANTGCAGHRQPDLEAETGTRWQCSRNARQDVSRRARIRRRRQPDEFNPFNRFHHAQRAAQAVFSRDAVLELAENEAFARPLVNSGRLSTPTPYRRSPLNTPDEAVFGGLMQPGTNCADAPITVSVAGQSNWLLKQLGDGFHPAELRPRTQGRKPSVLSRDPLMSRCSSRRYRFRRTSDGLVEQRYDGQIKARST